MPRFDGTGPAGYGPMTGRGFGPCARGGFGFRRFQRWLPQDEVTELELAEKELTAELEAIRQRRKDLEGQK